MKDSGTALKKSQEKELFKDNLATKKRIISTHSDIIEKIKMKSDTDIIQ
jgi:hypothetical protein